MLHVDLLLQHREPTRVELREVEHVVDEAREALGLLRDDLERDAARIFILDEALAERGDVASDRGQRRSQLVRHGHEEVPLELLRLAQPARHHGEAVRQQRDLVAAANARNRHAVVAARNLVRRARKLEHGTSQPPRDENTEDHRHQEAAEQRERDPLQQRHHACRELVLRLRHDERAGENRASALPAELERLRDREPRLARSRQLEVELQRPPTRDRRKVDRPLRQRAQPLPDVDAGLDRHVVDAVARRVLEPPCRHRVVGSRRLLGVKARQPGGLAP